MDIGLFGRGLLVGFSIAAPVGPIGVLCIRRTLTLGLLAGLLSGLGAATADAVYSAIAAYGLTAISGILVGQSFWFRLVGGIFLIYLGVQTFLAKPATKPAELVGLANAQGLAGVYFSTVVLTMTNPATIIERESSRGEQNPRLLSMGCSEPSRAHVNGQSPFLLA